MPTGSVPSEKTVLVVEDEDAVRESFVDLISSKGIRVISGRNGLEGLELFLSQPVDLILTDYAMPRMDGEAMIERIKQVSPSVPVILLTAACPDDTILRLLRHPRFFALHKPLRAYELFAALEFILTLPALTEVPLPRTSFRLETDIQVMLEGIGKCVARNLSESGAFLQVSIPPSLGSQLRCVLELPELLELEATVIWRRESGNTQALPAGVGIRFSALTPNAKDRLRRYLQNEAMIRPITWSDPKKRGSPEE